MVKHGDPGILFLSFQKGKFLDIFEVVKAKTRVRQKKFLMEEPSSIKLLFFIFEACWIFQITFFNLFFQKVISLHLQYSLKIDHYSLNYGPQSHRYLSRITCVFHHAPYLLGQMTYFIDSPSEAILFSYRWVGKKTTLLTDLFIYSLIKEDYCVLSIINVYWKSLLLLPSSPVAATDRWNCK